MFNQFHSCHICFKISGSKNSENCQEYLLENEKFEHIMQHFNNGKEFKAGNKELERKIRSCFPKSAIILAKLKKYVEKRSHRKEESGIQNVTEKVNHSEELAQQKVPQEIVKAETNPEKDSKYPTIMCRICDPERKFRPTSKNEILREHIIRFHLPVCHKCAYCNHEAKFSCDLRKHYRKHHPNQPIEILSQKPADYDQKMGEMWMKCFNIKKFKRTECLPKKVPSKKIEISLNPTTSSSSDSKFLRCQLCKTLGRKVWRIGNSRQSIRDHIKRSHFPNRYKCPHCDYASSTGMVDVIRHGKSAHENVEQMEVLKMDVRYAEEEIRELAKQCLGIEI